MSEVYFVSGIDTDAGKSYATGWLASRLMSEGHSVATQKFIQTGNTGFSEDIEIHRRIMDVSLPEDADLITSPVIFSYPASAQLAARIDGKEIDLTEVAKSTALLSSRYDVVLVEGAGGLMVPLTDDYFAIDYAAEQKIPMILVTNSRLGSINHTILSLEAIKARGIELAMVLYNKYYDKDEIIAADTHGFVERYLKKHFHGTKMLDVPVIEK